MNIELQREEAAKALQTVAAFTGREPAQWQYLLLHATEGGVTASANNASSICTIDLPGACKEPGDVLIRADALVGLATRNGAVDKMTLTTSPGKGSILKGGGNRWRLPTLADDSGQVIEAETRTGFALPADMFVSMLAFVAHAMGRTDVRYWLNGACITLEEEFLTVVSSDGHRAAYATFKLAEKAPADRCGRVIAPQAMVLKLLSSLSTEGEVQIDVHTARYMIYGNIRFQGASVEGNYPMVMALIPEKCVQAVVSRDALVMALQRAILLLGDSRKRALRLELGDRLHLSFEMETADLDEWLTVTRTGEDKQRITINPHFLLEAVAAVPDEEVILGFPQDDNQSLRVDAKDTIGRTCIIMRMRD